MRPDLEILLSTTDRRDTDWLAALFEHGTEGAHILIVNQSDGGAQIPPDKLPAHVRVINQTGYGLSRSRNTALKNARGKYVLLADDDMLFLPGFAKRLIEAHRRLESPLLIFPMQKTGGGYFGPHRPDPYHLKNFARIYSGQMSFKSDAWKKAGLGFDERFGLGAAYPDAENYIFLTQWHRKGLPVVYAGGDAVVEHPPLTSSHFLERPGNIKARLAMYKLLYGTRVYAYFWKLMFFLWRTGRIAFSDIGFYWRWIRDLKI